MEMEVAEGRRIKVKWNVLPLCITLHPNQDAMASGLQPPREPVSPVCLPAGLHRAQRPLLLEVS